MASSSSTSKALANLKSMGAVRGKGIRKEEEREGIEVGVRNVSAADLEPTATKAGVLEKRSEQGLVHNWKRRHCVLSDALLYYFEAPDSKKPQGERRAQAAADDAADA